jgi:hypothetical protein
MLLLCSAVIDYFTTCKIEVMISPFKFRLLKVISHLLSISKVYPGTPIILYLYFIDVKISHNNVLHFYDKQF